MKFRQESLNRKKISSGFRIRVVPEALKEHKTSAEPVIGFRIHPQQGAREKAFIENLSNGIPNRPRY